MKSELAKVGPAWNGGDINRWPGVGGVANITNHLGYNNDPFLPDPENSNSTLENKMVGGKRARRTKKTRRKKSRNHSASRKHHLKKSRKKPPTKKRRHRTRRYRGGSHHGNTLMPQSLVNLGRNMQYNIQNSWSAFTGAQPPVNPDPQVQPIGLR